jgi:uncharacterized membrane protein
MPDIRYQPPAAPLANDTPGQYAGDGRFSIGRCLSDGWRAMWRNLLPWAGMLFLAGAVLIAAISLMAALASVSPLLAVAVALVVYALGVPMLGFGFIRFCLNALEGRARASDLFAGVRAPILSMSGMLACIVLVSLPTAAPNVAIALKADAATIGLAYAIAVIWGCLISVRLYFAWIFLVDRRFTAIQCLSSSWAATRGNVFGLLLLSVLSLVLSMAGALVLLIGLIPAQLLVFTMWMSAYRQITGSPQLTAARAA